MLDAICVGFLKLPDCIRMYIPTRRTLYVVPFLDAPTIHV